MTRPPQEVIAVAWYAPDQWKRLRRVAVDAHLLDDSYEAWLAAATDLVDQLQRDGRPFAKVFVDVADLAAWCAEHGLPPSGAARSQFVAELARANADRFQIQSGRPGGP